MRSAGENGMSRGVGVVACDLQSWTLETVFPPPFAIGQQNTINVFLVAPKVADCGAHGHGHAHGYRCTRTKGRPRFLIIRGDLTLFRMPTFLNFRTPLEGVSHSLDELPFDFLSLWMS